MKIIAMLAVALISLIPATASAQGATCAPRNVIVKRLMEKYGETRQSAGLTGPKVVMEMFASEETGTWTLLMTHSNGVTCFAASGKAWQGDLGNASPKGAPT